MKRLIPFLLLLPALLLGLLFLAGILNALVQSFGYIPSFGLNTFTLDYYRDIFSRPELLASVGISLQIAGISSVLAAVLGVLLCAALVRVGNAKGKILVRLPILVPHAVTALFAITLLSQNGLVARLLKQEDFPALLFQPNNAGIILSYLWKEIPFVAYFVFALMAGISDTLGEAAENLGASGTKAFFHVTLPLCMPAALNAFFIIFAYSFGSYELPYLLGATVPKALPVQAYVEYTHPDLLHRPYAMAMNGVMLLAALLLSVGYFVLIRKTTKGIRHEA